MEHFNGTHPMMMLHQQAVRRHVTFAHELEPGMYYNPFGLSDDDDDDDDDDSEVNSDVSDV